MNTLQTNSSETRSLKKLEGKYLFFTLANESYGIDVLKVREIIKLLPITPVPEAPDYIKGVINLRGKVIPVIDLRLKFRLERHEMTTQTCILVVMIKSGELNHLVGIIVDGMEEVISIRENDIEEIPDFGSCLSLDYLLGVVKVKNAVKMLMNIDHVIHAEVLPLNHDEQHSQVIPT